jgi:hypothetical protein
MVEMTRKEVQTDRRRFGMRSNKFTSPNAKQGWMAGWLDSEMAK